MERPEKLTRAIVAIDGLDTRAVLPATGPHPAFRQVNGVPAADLLLRHLAQQGITDAWLVSRSLPGMVVHYFGDGTSWGLRVTHVRQDGPQGSGGSISAARDHITESVLLIDGTLVTNVRLGALFDAHRRVDVDVTMCVSTVVRESAGLPQVRVEEPAGLIRVILPDAPLAAENDDLRGIGAYIIEPESVQPLESAGVNADWIGDVLPELADRGRVQIWVPDADISFDVPRRVRTMRMQSGRGTSAN